MPTAASLVPSADMGTACILNTLRAVHVNPESDDVLICPPEFVAAKIEPSAELAMPLQEAVLALAVQAAPELVEV